MKVKNNRLLPIVLMFVCFNIHAQTMRNINSNNRYATSQACQRIIMMGRNNFYTKAGGNMPATIRTLRDAVLTSDIDKLKHSYHLATTTFQKRISNEYINEQLLLALGDAAMVGNTRAIAFLVAHGVDVNGKTATSTNPAIMLAAQCNRVDAMKALYKNGANVNIESKQSIPSQGTADNAIEVAVELGWNDSISWLLYHGADTCSAETAKNIHKLMNDHRIKSRIHRNLWGKIECAKAQLP